ncbi:MAG: HAD-IC family P-type ATPase [Egicoccus sp.]
MVMVDARDQNTWHALPAEDVARLLHAPAEGLDAPEAASRLATVGPNVLEEAPPPSLLATVADQFRSPLIAILLVATLVTVALGEYLDAIVIGVVLALNAGIGTFQERKAERSVRALQHLVAPKARVLRDGHEREVPSADLVPGDTVLLESGARVPADLRLVACQSLTVDESLLTGESASVRKQTDPLEPDTPLADRTNLAFAGSVVARGRGRGYVTATGVTTELGMIAEQVRTTDSPRTPVQVRVDRFARGIGVIVLTAAGLAFGIGLLMGNGAAEMFTFAVALAVSAVPEGLPVAFTITMAVGVTRMARQRAIIRRLPAVEALGSTTVVCSDKTGTLTKNEMTVSEIRTAGGRYVAHGASERDNVLGAEDVAEHRELYLTLLTGVLASEAEAYLDNDGTMQVSGDPTEAALVRVAAEVGLEPWRLRSERPVTHRLPFEPERRFAAVRTRIGGEDVALFQGAPEVIVGACDRQLADGECQELDRERVTHDLDDLASQGRRVLAFAYRPWPAGQSEFDEDAPPSTLVFVGLQGMVDPPREGAREAVTALRQAGIRVVMVTGDHAATAATIAREIQMDAGTSLTGQDLDLLDDEALQARLASVGVLARVAPEQKLRIVRALRERGEVVAVTGDGVNDAPALHAADIGIAMGRAGTDVAREAADMVLADDDFVTIRAAVEQGRITFDNLRKVTFFLISTGAAEIVMLLTGLALGWPLILLPAQLLWLNLVTNGIQDIALAFEPAEPGVLERPPRNPREGLVSRLLWSRTALVAVVMGLGTLAVFRWSLGATGSVDTARAAAMTTMVLFQAVHVGNSRRERHSAFSTPPWSNRFLLASVAAALAVHAAALYLPPTQWLLRVEPLPLRTWVVAAATSISVLAAVEVHKALTATPRHPSPGPRAARPRRSGGRTRAHH